MYFTYIILFTVFPKSKKTYSKKSHQKIIRLWNSNENNIKQIVVDSLTQRKQELNITFPVEIELNKIATCDSQEKIYENPLKNQPRVLLPEVLEQKTQDTEIDNNEESKCTIQISSVDDNKSTNHEGIVSYRFRRKSKFTISGRFRNVLVKV